MKLKNFKYNSFLNIYTNTIEIRNMVFEFFYTHIIYILINGT